jgi:hypothetical protein
LRALACVTGAGWRSTALAVVAYTATPVGPYREALVGQLIGPFSGSVPWIVVDDEASAAAGRAHWGLPKQLAALRVADGPTEASVDAAGAQLHVQARWTGPSLPVAVRGTLRQPGRAPAPLRFRGRFRPALVRLTGAPPCGLRVGTRPGALLEGTLVLGPPRG